MGGSLYDIANTLSYFSAMVPEYGNIPFFGVAPAESMYQVKESFGVEYGGGCSTQEGTPCGCCPSMPGSPAAATFPGVLHVGCGSCVLFTASDGKQKGHSIGGVVVDTCPYFQNKVWCPQNSEANPSGYKNHIDILYNGDEND